MLLVIGTIRLSPENLSRARDGMRKLIEGTRAEEGCHAYNYAEDLLDPGLIHIDEVWSDQAALDRHLQAPHVAEWRGVAGQYAISERKLTVYDVAGSRPL